MLDLTVLITFNTILNLENVIFYFHEIFVVKKFVMKHLIYEDKQAGQAQIDADRKGQKIHEDVRLREIVTSPTKIY